MAPWTLTSFALSLLLVFRTNSSYGRFDEARKMWGLMLNRSRDIVRMGLAFFPENDPRGFDNQRKKVALARWMGVFTISLKCHLTPGEDLSGEAGKLLTDRELELLLSAEHKVLCPPLLSRSRTIAYFSLRPPPRSAETHSPRVGVIVDSFYCVYDHPIVCTAPRFL